jgi:hypothetical protein
MLELFRILVIVFLVMHGLVHGVWFLAAWTHVRTGFGDGTWILFGKSTIRSPLGKVWGIGGLVALALFTLGAVGLALDLPGWVNPTNLGVYLSFAVVVPWWRQSPGSIGVTAVFTNLALMFLLALPLAQEMVTSS